MPHYWRLYMHFVFPILSGSMDPPDQVDSTYRLGNGSLHEPSFGPLLKSRDDAFELIVIGAVLTRHSSV